MKSAQGTILYLRTDISDQEIVAGGSVSHTTGVISGLIKRGYRVIVAASMMQKQIEQLSITRFYKLQNPRVFSFLRWKINCLLSNVFFSVQVLRSIKKEKISYIYQRYSILNCVGVLISTIKKLPLVLEYNGSEVWVEKEWAVKKKFKLLWLINKIEIFNLRSAQRIIVVSDPLKEELIKRGIQPEKILVNPNGVDPYLFDPLVLEPLGKEIRNFYKIPENAFVVGFIGTFSQWHGVELIAEIVSALTQKKDNIFFILVGDGPLLGMLRKNLEDFNAYQSKIIMPGMVAHECARKYLAACDAFISPNQPNKDGSRFFGSPTKLFEYMSLAKPVIASDLEQLAQIIVPAVRADFLNDKSKWATACGFLAESNRPEEFIRAIRALADASKNDLKVIGNNARTEILRYYSWNAHVARIDEFAKGRE
ncbi:MAG TPA: glycosyltransferase family 4 protein [Candidatus Babeliales bacterium]|nr:glycosyltransferase family 4 protein [Candidatus Babeliales bacterium]